MFLRGAVRVQAAGASITIKGDLFLQLISVRTDMLLRDVAILDAYFFFFVISGIALLYLTMPRALVMRRCTDTSDWECPCKRLERWFEALLASMHAQCLP